MTASGRRRARHLDRAAPPERRTELGNHADAWAKGGIQLVGDRFAGLEPSVANAFEFIQQLVSPMTLVVET